MSKNIEGNPEYLEAKSAFILADANCRDNPTSNRFINEYNKALERVQSVIARLEKDNQSITKEEIDDRNKTK